MQAARPILWISLLFPKPLWPTNTTFWLRRMKSHSARASILRRGMAGLKFQSKVLRGRASEVRLLDEAFDAALTAQAGLIGEQAVQELQVRAAAVLGLLQDLVELFGRHGAAQSGEVGENLLTQSRIRVLGVVLAARHGRVPQGRAGVDSRWSGVARSVRHAG